MAFGLVAGLASFALQGASALASASAQSAERKANARNALQAFRLNIADLGERAVQAEQGAAQEFGLIARQGTAAASTIAASAAESGVSGSSVSALLAKFAAETSTAQSVVGASLDNTLSELTRRAEGERVEFQGRLNAVPGPSGLVTGLQIAGAGLDLLRLTRGGPRSTPGRTPALQRGNLAPSEGR